MKPKDSPIAAELFAQWAKARGARASQATRPFSRNWEELLDRAGLVSGAEQETAERDIRELEEEGWLETVPVRYYPHRIYSIRIPLDRESRWKVAFAFVDPDDGAVRQIREWPWCGKMEFVRDARIAVPFENLRSLDAFLKSAGNIGESVPIKEQSLQIFGDEKRLDELFRGSSLFAEGRLTLEDFGCHLVPEPLPWERGKLDSGPVIVLENAATWDTFRRWDIRNPQFSATVYGGGSRFTDGVQYLERIFTALDGIREVRYFGDLDASGLRIPRIASIRAKRLDLPPVRPHISSYYELFQLAADGKVLRQPDLTRPSEADLNWLGEARPQAEVILQKFGRIAQEWLGWDILARQGDDVMIHRNR